MSYWQALGLPCSKFVINCASAGALSKIKKMLLNPFPSSRCFCRLLSHLVMFLDNMYCKQYGPRSDSSLWSSLIRVHCVCFHDKILSEVNINICSRSLPKLRKVLSMLGKYLNNINFTQFFPLMPSTKIAQTLPSAEQNSLQRKKL